MTGGVRLFLLEARRSTAIWFVPIVLAITWYATREPDAYQMTLWSKTSAQVGQALIALGPLIGGLAAWIAGRERRRGIEDLLATTPRSPVTRDLLGYASTATWGIFAYLFAVAAVFAITARTATWGTPDLLPVAIGMATIALSVAFGYAAGLYLPSRFTPALVPILLILALLVPANITNRANEFGQYTYHQSSVQYLTPWTFVDPGDYDPFYESWPNIALPLFTWLLGLTVVALVAIALRRRRGPFAWGILLGAALVVSIAGTALRRTDVHGYTSRASAEFEPVCRSSEVVVCIHPAYETMLDDVAELVYDLTQPIAGLPGVPTRVEQAPTSTRETPQETLRTHFYNWIYNGEWGRSADAEAIVRQIICEPHCDYNPKSGYLFGDPARSAIGVWLLEQAGIEPSVMLPPHPGQERMREQVAEAKERFAALDPDERRAWFEQHFADLRAGRLDLDALP